MKSILNNFKNEIIHLAIILLGFVVAYFSVNSNEKTLDINVHDTYFVINKLAYLSVITIIIIYFYLFFRIIYLKFNKIALNFIYIFLSIIFIYFYLDFLTNISIEEINNGWEVNPPASSIKQKVYNSNSNFYTFSKLFLITLFSFIIFIAFISGKKMKYLSTYNY